MPGPANNHTYNRTESQAREGRLWVDSGRPIVRQATLSQVVSQLAMLAKPCASHAQLYRQRMSSMLAVSDASHHEVDQTAVFSVVHKRSMRCSTPASGMIGRLHARVVSAGHLWVASIPSFEPTPATGLAKSR